MQKQRLLPRQDVYRLAYAKLVVAFDELPVQLQMLQLVEVKVVMHDAAMLTTCLAVAAL